ncbi:MAG TPA: hypothetical protein VJU18_17220 [Vicinamibacteria bacterium]|nr:hypothetical protein [Vicinamibacteria bacterium]
MTGLLSLSVLLMSLAGAREAPSVTLTWKVKGGQDVYGCLVYRAGRREGPFLRISPRILRLPPGSGEDARDLSFVDTRVEKGKTYYYYLDIVRDSGTKERFSPVLSKTVE